MGLVDWVVGLEVGGPRSQSLVLERVREVQVRMPLLQVPLIRSEPTECRLALDCCCTRIRLRTRVPLYSLYFATVH
jgi:hypothetical protein